jgi:hypothetical protein
MITAEIIEYDKDGNKVDYVAYNKLLEEQRRRSSRTPTSRCRSSALPSRSATSPMAPRRARILRHGAAADRLAVYWYCHSLRFTLLPVACSLTSLVWQFGTLRLLGYGLDPLAVLVPFLVFAIGVSHGVQQINFIVREISHGKSCFEACRASFSGLLVPGVLALVTAFVSFVTLVMIPIPMVRELAITASLGVAFKIITNLVMLPVAASYFKSARPTPTSDGQARGTRRLAAHAGARGRAAQRRAVPGHGRGDLRRGRGRAATAVGTLQPGAPELREESRFNRDAVAIAATSTPASTGSRSSSRRGRTRRAAASCART